MEAGILTVGDELLDGDIENTNATWIAARLTGQGVDVQEIRVVPDEVDRIAGSVRPFADRFDAVVVTGGLGSTPDDMTLEAVSEALGRPLEPNDRARRLIEETLVEVRERRPDIEFDIEAASYYPAGATVIPNREGIMPGCRCGSVYVTPGIPNEMRAVFERVQDRLTGDRETRTVFSDVPESNLNGLLTDVADRYGVRVGCYPGPEGKRIRISSPDRDQLDVAYEWLADQPEITIDAP